MSYKFNNKGSHRCEDTDIIESIETALMWEFGENHQFLIFLQGERPHRSAILQRQEPRITLLIEWEIRVRQHTHMFYWEYHDFVQQPPNA